MIKLYRDMGSTIDANDRAWKLRSGDDKSGRLRKEGGGGRGGVVVDPSKCLPLEKKDFTLFSIDESIAESIGIILQGQFDREILLIRDIH